jgi:(E)-4-hydroxy-3-methylbut-2-enyl-diphosphate synthase
MTTSAISPIPRRRSIGVQVGSIMIGGAAPIIVQSMTNTDTADAVATVRQVQQLAAAGSRSIPKRPPAR